MQPGMQMAEMVTVVVPTGASPGNQMPVQFPSGSQMMVMIPQNVQAGMSVTVYSSGQMVPAGMPMQQPMMQQPMMQQPMMQQPMMQHQPVMQQPMMAPMQQPMFQGVDAWQIIQAMPSCEIAEEIQWGEVLTEFIGVEVDFANKYKVKDPNDVEVLLFAEETDFCTRQMKRGSCADCVGWHVRGLNIYGGQRVPFLNMQRDTTCTCCCFNRPQVEISDVATGNVIGFIRDPFACCDFTFQVKGPDEADVLYAKGGCCQCGILCPLPCGPCAEVNFEIVDAKTSEKIGHIQKKVPSCCKFLIDSEIDNYKVDFTGVNNPQWKAMLMALAVFIDFRYFSNTQDPDEVGSTGLLGAAMAGGDGGDGGGDLGDGGDGGDAGDGGDGDGGGDE